MDRASFPIVVFEDALVRWRERRHKQFNLLASAGLRDGLALLESAPARLECSLPRDWAGRNAFMNLHEATLKFLKSRFIPAFTEAAGKWSRGIRSGDIKVVSPLAGPIPSSCFGRAQSVPPAGAAQLKLGVLNPGRCGFIGLASEDILWWRLWDIALTCHTADLNIVVIPGPRLPAGVMLPPAFPYVYLGHRSSSWDSVGLFVASEFTNSVTVLDVGGSTRILWCLIHSASPGLPWLLGALYGPPQSDPCFWDLFFDELTELRRTHRVGHCIIAGDFNVHFSFLV